MNLETHAKATELLEEIEDIRNTVDLLENAEDSYLLFNHNRLGIVKVLMSEKLREDIVTLLTTERKQLEEEFKKL
jgi:hypothetical protein